MRSVGSNWRSLTRRSRMKKKAASLGLEPRQRDPESLVLPLHHEARARGQDLKLNSPVAQADRKPTHAAINRGSVPHLRARLRPQDNFRFLRRAFAPSGPSFDHFVVVRRVVVEENEFSNGGI